MARSDANDVIISKVFTKGWSRIKGGKSLVGTGRARQVTRAVRGYSAAVFKPIKAGGCSSRQQLIRQLEYLTSKSSHIIDSRGIYSGKQVLDAKQIAKVADRFCDRWNEKFSPKMGNTTHMLMSFPIGTKAEHVRDIVDEICSDHFQSDLGDFDYVAAVHTDRDHPHAHIVLNRRGHDGQMFYFGKDHHYNYDVFKEAMVDVADRYGVRLQSATRLEKGILSYAPKVNAIYAAKKEGVLAAETPRQGADLERALERVQGIADSVENLGNSVRVHSEKVGMGDSSRMADALFSAAKTLREGGHIQSIGEVYIENIENTEKLIETLNAAMSMQFAKIFEAPEIEQAKLRSTLYNQLRPIAHLDPLGPGSNELTMKPQHDGIYTLLPDGMKREDVMSEPSIFARLEAAVEGTGISPSVVLSRIEVGANSAAIEKDWRAEDLRTIALKMDYDLTKPTELQDAIDRMRDVHNKLVRALAETEVVEATSEITPGGMIDKFLVRVRENFAVQGLKNGAEIEEFKHELSLLLDDERWDRVHRGDETALDVIVESKLDRLLIVEAILDDLGDKVDHDAILKVRTDIAKIVVEERRVRNDWSNDHVL